MIIYDSTSLAFIRKTETMVKEILISIGIEVRRNRFLYKNYLYPMHVVVFEGKEWGHFNHSYFQIGLNRRLISEAKDSVIKDILKHELAHYLTYIQHGEVQPHGPEFKNLCRELNFPDEVAHATMNLENENTIREGDIHSEKIIEKVKKLLQLAQSSNSHEAELATLKANQILLRHNLDFTRSEEEPIYMDRLLMRSRKDSKLSAIYDILRHFIVRPVISQGKRACCLEVSGTLTNVKLARYVAEFLDRELDHLWKTASAEHGLQGLRAKNSFYLGVARGFDEKMKANKQSFSETDRKALVVVEKQLDEKVRSLYRGLRHTTSGHESDSYANSVGGEYGKNLNIRQGVESTGRGLALSYNGVRS
jgi:hypothetical protein